jgi:hypothetical protein
MKTLYDSLKQEYKDKIEANGKDYPATVRSIKKSLYYNELWSRLTVSQVTDIIAFTDTPFHNLKFNDWAYGTKFLIHED